MHKQFVSYFIIIYSYITSYPSSGEYQMSEVVVPEHMEVSGVTGKVGQAGTAICSSLLPHYTTINPTYTPFHMDVQLG